MNQSKYSNNVCDVLRAPSHHSSLINIISFDDDFDFQSLNISCEYLAISKSTVSVDFTDK